MFTSLREINALSVVFRVVLSLIIGGIFGIERGHKKRPAGFRTYMLVSVGATLVMMTNQYVYQEYQATDLVRMGAQVVSGIGFLGAGTIMVTGRNQIKGITTAAGLWTAACCGLCVGIGFYEGAIIGALAIIFVMAALHRIDNYIHSHSKVMELYIEIDNTIPFSEFLRFARGNDLEITDIQVNMNKISNSDLTTVILSVSSPKRWPHNEIISLLQEAPGLRYIEKI